MNKISTKKFWDRGKQIMETFILLTIQSEVVSSLFLTGLWHR